MNDEPPVSSSSSAAAGAPRIPAAIPQPRKAPYVPGSCLLRAVLCVLILAALFFVLVPVTTTGCGHSAGSKAMAQAKQIGLALKLYAGDHDGAYPAGVNTYGEPIRTSNDAFRSLFPVYITSEAIFGNKLSAYQTAPADNVMAPPSKILQAGENVYSYVAGLDESFPPSTPLIMDGTDGTGLGLYVSDPKARGGVWSGQKAVVVRLDNSARLENLAGPVNVRYVVRHDSDGSRHNLLGPDVLGPKVKLLDPAVVPPETR